VRLTGAVLALASIGAVAPAGEPSSPVHGEGRIRGNLISGRKPLVAARVIAFLPLADHDLVLLTTTDLDGVYQLNDIPAGTWRLEVQAEGHLARITEGIEVRPPFRNILDFRLEPIPAAGAGGLPEAVTLQEPVAEGAGSADVFGTVTLLREGAIQEVADAEIALLGGPPPGQYLILSDEQGRFVLPAVPAGRYEFRVTAPGAIPLLMPRAEVRAGRPIEVQVRLINYPVELAAKRQLILPPEEPLPPLRLHPLPLPEER
jgi:hypothetical protein